MDEEKTPQLKILVVDDDILNQQMMKFLLMQWGHNVSFAGNGVEAVDAVKASRFDIVFMDLQMPVMDGVSASRNIREWEDGNHHTYIVALTASYQPEEGQLLFESGIDNYIAKPFEVEHIRHILKYTGASFRRVDAADWAIPADETSIRDVLNIQRGIERVGSSPETYWSLLHDFIAELPNRLNDMQEAFALKDFESLSRSAHNLKGVSANLGALQLSEYADRLDKVSEAGYTRETADLVDELRTASVALQGVAGKLFRGRKINASE
ncbi:MAG TPA: response regulator [Anaerolineales bacterium]|nr:response regulator [Anaerolineales bacterium]